MNLLLVLMVLGSIPSALLAQSNTLSSQSSSVSWWKQVFCTLSWDETILSAESPRTLCWQVKRHVSYRAEAGDQWFSGRTIWNRGYGDCKAFASCVEDLCEAKGYICWTAGVYPVGSRSAGHNVVMGLWNGRMWMASNGDYYDVVSLDDALNKVSNTIQELQGGKLEFVPLSY